MVSRGWQRFAGMLCAGPGRRDVGWRCGSVRGLSAWLWCGALWGGCDLVLQRCWLGGRSVECFGATVWWLEFAVVAGGRAVVRMLGGRDVSWGDVVL